MIKEIEPVLYIDTQAARPVGMCTLCGAELYAYGSACPRCERRQS